MGKVGKEAKSYIETKIIIFVKQRIIMNEIL